MTITYRDGLSILELIVYTPSLLIALVMDFRNEFSLKSGWHFFLIFSLLRVIGNGCYLGTINDPDSTSLYLAYGICNSIGLSPLLLGMLALLHRVNASIKRQTGSAYWPSLFVLLGLVALVSMIPIIVGVASASSLTSGLNSKETKAGMILYMVVWVAFAALIFLVWVRHSSVQRAEHRVLWAITIVMPVLAVRIVYSALAVFKHSSTFNMITGNDTVFLVMDILEEIFIVYVLVLTGIGLAPIQRIASPSRRDSTGGSPYDNIEMPREQQAVGGSVPSDTPAARPYKKRPIKGTPLMMLIAFIMNKIDERRQ